MGVIALVLAVISARKVKRRRGELAEVHRAEDWQPGDVWRRYLWQGRRNRGRDSECGGGKGNRHSDFPVCDPVSGKLKSTKNQEAFSKMRKPPFFDRIYLDL